MKQAYYYTCIFIKEYFQIDSSIKRRFKCHETNTTQINQNKSKKKQNKSDYTQKQIPMVSFNIHNA